MSPRVAIITGAAGGIGAAIAQRLLADGYATALIDCNEAALRALAHRLDASTDRYLLLPGDLADLTFVESIAPQTIERFGSIDAVVNNAAWRELVTMREILPQSWQRTLDVCLTGPAFLSREVAKHFETRGRGVIVNVSSIMAQQAAGFAPAYVACKGAIESLTYDLAALYGPHGVRVVAISPGAIDTQLSHDVEASHSLSTDDLRGFAESMAMLGRFGRADEVAAAIAWVASDEASYLTGVTITLDGGWSRHHLPTPLAAKSQPQGKP
jgi:3-oxoacyl-[acyl-carrier protein] reductase